MSYSLPPRPEFYIPDVLVRAREEESTALQSKLNPSAVFSKAKVGLRKAKARAAAAASIAAHDIGTSRMRKVANRQKRKQKHHDHSNIKRRITENARIMRSRTESNRASPKCLLSSSLFNNRYPGLENGREHALKLGDTNGAVKVRRQSLRLAGQ